MAIDPHRIQRSKTGLVTNLNSITKQLDPNNPDDDRVLGYFSTLQKFGADIMCIPPCEHSHTTYLAFNLGYKVKGFFYNLKGTGCANPEMCITHQHNRLMEALKEDVIIIANPEGENQQEFIYDKGYNIFRRYKTLDLAASN